MAGKTVLSRCQSERGGKRFRDAEQFDRHQTRFCMHVASEALLPVETIMRPLRAGQGRRPERWTGRSARFHLHLHTLVTQQMDARPPMKPPAPISPEHRSRTNGQRMQEETDLARFRGSVALPLALRAQWARAATADAGRIHHAQAAIGFSTLLLGNQRAPCWTPQRPIGLKRKLLT
jgi:hypothetical protein